MTVSVMFDNLTGNVMFDIFRADLVKGEWKPDKHLVELEKEMVMRALL